MTTAAALWLVTAIGMCAGSGMFLLALAVTAMGLLALALLQLFEGKHAAGYRRIISLELNGSLESLQRVLDRFADSGIVFTEFDYRKAVTENEMEVTFEARAPRGVGIGDLIQKIEQDPNVRHIRVGFPK